MDRDGNRKPEASQKSTRPRVPWFWWIVLLALLVWNVFLFLPQGQAQATLPYNVFVDQLQSGNVTEVHITGSQIEGTLEKAIVWPQGGQGASQVSRTLPLLPSAPATPQKYTAFTTTFPDSIGDTSLMPLLRSKGVQVDVSQPSTPWYVLLLTDGLPILLLVGLVIYVATRSIQGQSGIFAFGKSKARRYEGDRPTVTFSDVAGASEAVTELHEVVDFLRSPLKYHQIGARIPRGILLVGPPGTGKTLLARAVSGEAGVPFFSISASEFVEMFVGVGASRVRDLFEQAKQNAPAIVFIDELDAVGRRRGAGLGAVNDEREQTLNQLLVEMDGFDEKHGVIILAATNRPDVLDPALLRPGRFDRRVVVGLPDRNGREGILGIHTRSLNLAPDVDLILLSRTTTGLSGADLANLCNEAALLAASKDRKQITCADFEEALDKILLGGVRPMLLDDHDRRVVAYHESGHALVAWLTPEADPVRKVSIIPRGRALGVTEQVPGDDRYNLSRDYLTARLAVMLAGRGAEELALGEVTTGAENDLVEGTRLARRMVTRWGMGSLRVMAFQADDQQPFLGYELAQGRDYSEATAARIDLDVEKLLDQARNKVQQLLEAQRALLDKLVKLLLREETLDEQDLERVLGPRAVPEPQTLVLPQGSEPQVPVPGRDGAGRGEAVREGVV
ncbi:MAG: ATP-dependent zinc metalloprotease FtsH [Anaerolineales bacterium]